MILEQDFYVRILSSAREADHAECCGLVGGSPSGQASSLYPLRNIAGEKFVSYEAAPEELFAAQRQMRERGEELIAIYHSHAAFAEPAPSETDVRLAYYPNAVYLIVGRAGPKPVVRAFRISAEGIGKRLSMYCGRVRLRRVRLNHSITRSVGLVDGDEEEQIRY